MLSDARCNDTDATTVAATMHELSDARCNDTDATTVTATMHELHREERAMRNQF